MVKPGIVKPVLRICRLRFGNGPAYPGGLTTGRSLPWGEERSSTCTALVADCEGCDYAAGELAASITLRSPISSVSISGTSPAGTGRYLPVAVATI